MGVAAVETGLAAVVSRPQFLCVHAPLADPELTLRRTAGKNDVGELFNLLANRSVGGLSDAGRAVSGAAGDGD